MIVYNVTSAIDESIEKEWVAWMKDHHMPDVIGTKMFTQFRLYKILATQEPRTVSYSAQYMARSMEDVNTYLEKFAPALRAEVSTKYGEKAVSFRTLLEEV